MAREILGLTYDLDMPDDTRLCRTLDISDARVKREARALIEPAPHNIGNNYSRTRAGSYYHRLIAPPCLHR